MSRALWKGALSFGLVNIPIELHTAVRDNRPRFRMLHASDKSPIKFQRVCARDGTPVAWDDLVKGYEYEKGRFVVLTKEDFQAAALEKSRTVDILDFVKSEEIDDRFFETPYYLLPAEGRRARVRAAARGHPRVRPHRHREDHPARDAAPGCTAGHRRRARPDDDAVCRRTGRHLRVHVPGRRRRALAGARDGARARREPGRELGARQVHRRLPREPDEGDPRQAEGTRPDAPHEGGAAVGRCDRPDGAAAPKPGEGAEEGGKRRRPPRRPPRRGGRRPRRPPRRARRRSGRPDGLTVRFRVPGSRVPGWVPGSPFQVGCRVPGSRFGRERREPEQG